jgi:peptide methionine sulfoxide reductase msrA/msrB
MNKRIVSCISIAFILSHCTVMDSKNMKKQLRHENVNELDTATFAGGCFWCTEAAFSDLDGVKSVISGYTGGTTINPSYEEVCSGTTGHYEAVQISFDPNIISYSELVDIFWRQIDPTDEGGSFVDRGSQYQSAIFYHSERQKIIADSSKKGLEQSGIFDKPIATKVIKALIFYPAESYHQQYCKNNSTRYYSYRSASGREIGRAHV